MSTDPRTRAWIEVSSASLRRNLRRLQDAVPAGVRSVPMVKADGYGLGMTRVVDALAPADPWGWGVATVDEGARLRSHGVRSPVIVFSPLPPGAEARAVESRLTPTVSDLDTLDRLRRHADGGMAIHLEVDPGMGRAGFPWWEVEEWAAAVVDRLTPPLRWEGLFTHFHSADEPGGPGVEAQLRRFSEVVAALDPPPDVLLHAANSAGALRLGQNLRSFGLIRPGIGVYGGECGPDLPRPEGVVSLRARVIRVTDVPEGTTVGYGATYRASGPERWATLAVGYGDGYRRAASNRGQVLLQGRRVPVVGRVSMDMTVVNITGLDGVRPGSVSTLLGRDGGAEIRLDEVAEWTGTISYEVLTGFSGRLPRIWLPSPTE
ncbi:MAG: alanine racemase [Gemmatimonadota bacterium]